MGDKRIVLEREKATIYWQSLFSYSKHLVRDLKVGIGPYAQYKAGVHAQFVEKGKRRPRGFVQTSFANLVVLDGWEHTLEPDPMMGPDTVLPSGLVESRGRASACDSMWNEEFRAKLAAYCKERGIKPLADFHGHDPYGGEPGIGSHIHPAGEYTWRE